MSYTRNPNIRLIIPDSDFDLLISALLENADTENNPPRVAEGAGALYDKLMKYSRPYTNEDGKNLVDIRFYPNQASEMIWQLLAVCCAYVDVVGSFYSILKENHIPKERKEQSE